MDTIESRKNGLEMVDEINTINKTVYSIHVTVLFQTSGVPILKPKIYLVISLSLFIVLASSCGAEPDQKLSAEKLGEIAAEIRNQPEKVESILEDNKLSRGAFEERVREISQEPKLARRYRKSFESHLDRTK